MDPFRCQAARSLVIEPAELAWRDGQPYSPRFADIYHDPAGSAEVEQVFLGPAGFEELVATRPRLLVGETGFGTALNFAVVARHCLTHRRPLHFVSFEAAPIAPAEFRDICRQRRAAEPVYQALAPLYPPLLSGWHRRRLFGGLITLSLFWGDASKGLAELDGERRQPFDLWLLDGFAPSRNPEMWTEDLFRGIGRLATRDTRVSTFTSAGRVRRGLMDAGFSMRRVDQMPRKRESLAGHFDGPGRERPRIAESITIIGAGIAGAAVARELADSGCRVRVVEAAAAVAEGASSVPLTVMHPRLHHDGSAGASLKATAWAHAIAAVASYLEAGPESGIERTGALQVVSPNYPATRLAAVADRYRSSGLELELLPSAAASTLAGVRIDQEALWFPAACRVDTPRFTRTLLSHPAIEVVTGSAAADWPGGPAILACGSAAQQFPDAGYLELGRVSGQLDRVRTTGGAPLLPVVGHGYVATVAGETAVGATYEYTPWTPERASAENLKHLERLGLEGWEALGHHKAERCVSSDRQPVIGALYTADHAPLPERLVTTGHGSMGTVTSHLGAGVLTAMLLGEAPALESHLLALVSPLRFRIRQARRGYRFGARD